MPRAGSLRKRITILTPTDTPAGSIQKWTTFASCWAAVEPVSGTEVARSLDPTSVVMSNVTIRYRPGVLPKMRIQFGTRLLEISSVINLEERNHELHLVCHEVMN